MTFSPSSEMIVSFPPLSLRTPACAQTVTKPKPEDMFESFSDMMNEKGER